MAAARAIMDQAPSIDFAPMMGRVARRLLGEPNRALSRPSDLRWGSKGSMSVDPAKGAWHDHEANVGGGVLDLIRHHEGVDTAGAFRWLEDQGLKDRTPVAHREAGPVIRAAGRRFYDYTGADGEVVFRVERRGKDASPPFLQHGPDGRGGFHAARGCMNGVRRVLYRLPELLAADRATIVFVCEGEKDADALAALGLIATTNPGGAGKFTRDLARPLAGRRVVALQDNDQAGADHVAAVLAAVTGLAANAAALLLPGLPPKGDVSDWLGVGGTAADLTALAEAAFPAAATFPIADLSLWSRTSATPTPFYMAGHIPVGEVTLLTGAGGGNKSTFGQQLATCSAANLPMLGVDVMQGPALYVTAEDHEDRLHWMQEHICGALGVDMASLAGKLFLASIRGRLNNELATFDADGRLHPREAFHLVRSTIEATGAKLVVLDNVAHLFAGNENDRGQVTAFINLLYQLCRDQGVTILLIAHRNKAGDTYSGSTAWLNAVRSQLVIERPADSLDPDARVLTIGKANYARPDQQLAFRWHDFALILDSDLPDDRRAEIASVVMAGADNDAFLACLDQRAREDRHVSERPGQNYAPAEFEKMPEARGIGRTRLKEAMDRLFRMGQIERAVLRRDTTKGRDIEGLRRTPNATPKRFPNATPDVPQTTPGPDPERPPTYPPLLRRGAGAAFGAAPPVPDTAASRPAPVFTAEHPNGRRRNAPILAPGESPDDPVPGCDL